VGGWRRLPGKGAVTVEATLAVRLDAASRAALRAATARFETFLGHPVTLRICPTGGRMRAS